MTDDELTALIDALDEYDEARVRATIETAREADVGPRLLGRLAEMLDDDAAEADRLARLALVVIVVEADVPGAFAAVVDRIVEGGGADFVDDVMEYAVSHAGERGVRAALERMPSVGDPYSRAALYTLLKAAHGKGPELVDDVVAACHQWWPAERAKVPGDAEGEESGWTPAVALCYTLAVLGDPAARAMAAEELAKPRRKGHRDAWKYAAEYAAKYLGENPFDAERAIDAEEFEPGPEADSTADGDLDWRLDWPVQMPKWAKLYDEGEQAKLLASVRQQVGPIAELLDRLGGRGGSIDNLSYDDEPDDGYDDDADRPPTTDLFGEQVTMPIRAEPKVGRNEPCPCGSGKKYKKCHGAAGGAT